MKIFKTLIDMLLALIFGAVAIGSIYLVMIALITIFKVNPMMLRWDNLLDGSSYRYLVNPNTTDALLLYTPIVFLIVVAVKRALSTLDAFNFLIALFANKGSVGYLIYFIFLPYFAYNIWLKRETKDLLAAAMYPLFILAILWPSTILNYFYFVWLAFVLYRAYIKKSFLKK